MQKRNSYSHKVLPNQVRKSEVPTLNFLPKLKSRGKIFPEAGDSTGSNSKSTSFIFPPPRSSHKTNSLIVNTREHLSELSDVLSLEQFKKSEIIQSRRFSNSRYPYWFIDSYFDLDVSRSVRPQSLNLGEKLNPSLLNDFESWQKGKVTRTEPKSLQKITAKEIMTPSFKGNRESSPKSNTNFKEIQRLKSENSKLLAEIGTLREELRRKDEFQAVFSNLNEEKYDLRRMLLYKAKVAKQDRIVIEKQIYLMQTALDAQRALYFQMENIIGGILKLLKNTERPEQVIHSISSIIKPASKMLKDAESSSQVAYSQLLSSRKVSECIEIDSSSFPDWKSTVKVSGQEIFDTEITLSDLLSCLLTPGNPGVIGKLRDSCSKLLKLGIQLPLYAPEPESDVFDADAKKIIMLSVKPSNKNEVKEIIARLSSERKRIKIEKELLEKELVSKGSEVEQMELSIKNLKNDLEVKGKNIRNLFEENLAKPFADILEVFRNVDASSALQLLTVFKMHEGKIRKFIDSFAGFSV